MKSRFSAAITATLLLATAGSAPAQSKKKAAPKDKKVAMAGPSTAVTPRLLDAIAAELERASSSMRIPGAPPPYFISYKITEVEVNDASASLGAVLDAGDRHFVSLEAHVHVGSYEMDNSNFVSPRRENLDGIATIQLALEDSVDRARRAAWLVTDAAYKEAIEQYRAKADTMAAGAGRDLPSYSRAKPLAQPDPVDVAALQTVEELEKRAESISAAFRAEPHVRDSRVAFTSFLERRWYLNSDGTSATDTRRVGGVLVVASAQATDGQQLSLYFSKYGKTSADLPSNDQLTAKCKELSGLLKEMRSAPVAEGYTGPVLFEGRGAVDLVRNTLAPHLSGTPPPIGTSQDDDIRFAGVLTDRVGLRVVSPSITVVDDPTADTFKGTPIIGSYKFDDEGVEAQRVSVIKKGKLESLLMSRTPNKNQKESNGHARLSMPGGVFRGSATNLFVSATGGQSRAALRKKLVAEARAQGLDYGLVIKLLDDPAITANTEVSRLEMFQILQSSNRAEPPPALLAYRIYPDGREELVRGVQLGEIDMRAWRDVVAVGRDTTIANFLASTDDPSLQRIAGVGPGFVPSAGIESSVATPDILLREVDAKPTKLIPRRPMPLLAAPK